MSNAARLSATLDDLQTQLDQARRFLPKALENIAQEQGGYPSSTPGANASSAPTPGPDVDKYGNVLPTVKLTFVENLASQRDHATTARAKIIKLIHIIENPIADLRHVTTQWGYTAARPKFDKTDSNHPYCTSCLRLDRCVERHRGTLCRWCYDFHSTEDRLPSRDLLDRHHRGMKITQAMVKADHPVVKGRKTKNAAAKKAA